MTWRALSISPSARVGVRAWERSAGRDQLAATLGIELPPAVRGARIAVGPADRGGPPGPVRLAGLTLVHLLPQPEPFQPTVRTCPTNSAYVKLRSAQA
jgi:hypothetical protein